METKKETKKENKIDNTTLFKAMRTMFKNIKSGKTVYLAFSKNGFHLLIFALVIGTAANIALMYILLQGSGFIIKANSIIVTFQFILSGISIIAGIWLFFKGINIVVDK